MAAVVGNGGLGRVGGVGQPHESLRQALHRIPVAHPHRGSLAHVVEQIGGIVHEQGRLAVLGPAGCDHSPAELLHHQLHAITNPQHRDAQVPDRRVAQWRPRFIHRTGPATEDQAPGCQPGQLGRGGGVAHHQREHLGLPHAPGNQLGVLGAEVENHDRRGATGAAGRVADGLLGQLLGHRSGRQPVTRPPGQSLHPTAPA